MIGTACAWARVLFLAVKTREAAYKDLVAGARFYEILGYVLGALGVVIAAIPLGIYFDRKKKARKKKLRESMPGE
jgi:hypothetical protein